MVCVLWGWVSGFCFITWVWPVWTWFSPFLTAFLIYQVQFEHWNLSSMSSPVFILLRRLNSSTNLMSLCSIPFSRSLNKHLSSHGTKGDPFKPSLVMSPLADTSSSVIFLWVWMAVQSIDYCWHRVTEQQKVFRKSILLSALLL